MNIVECCVDKVLAIAQSVNMQNIPFALYGAYFLRMNVMVGMNVTLENETKVLLMFAKTISKMTFRMCLKNSRIVSSQILRFSSVN